MIRRLLIAVVCLIVVGVVVAHHFAGGPPPPPVVQPVAATQPTSQPTTRRVKPKYPSYMELVRAQNPTIAATQPLDFPLELPDSAHLVLHDPVYLDPTGNLWITRADGQPASKALIKPSETEDHVIQDKPVFVHWWPDENGNWAAALVVRGTGGNGYDIITKSDRKHLADDRPFQWKNAFSILGKIVVCTDVGVSVFDIQPTIQEHYHPLPGCNAGTNPPLTMLDTRGVLAWAPWENGRSGSNGVSRFVDGNWVDLPAADWPARPIQLSMLLDGSVLRMAAGAPPSTAPTDDAAEVPEQFPDQIHLSIGQLEATQLDQKHINDLINQLGDPDSDQRQAAFDELSRYGPEIAPILEKLGDDQLPEAKMRIHQLLRGKLTPALGGLTPVDSRLVVIRRCPDGTVILFAPSGVQIPTETDEPELINPAWLALRPDGRMERPLPAAMIHDQKPDACTLLSMRDEWILNDDAGPRRLVGNTFEPLLAPAEKKFTDLVGIASHRRWVFRDGNGQTLVIDPLIADPTPKLPAWVIVANKGIAGWDAENFPAVSRADQTGNWELQADSWKPLAAPEKVITQLPPATQPTTDSVKGRLLLVGTDGTRYFDGRESLLAVTSAGRQINWPLPATAVGSADPVLMQTNDGLLFLFNQPGRLLRIRPTPSAADPFKLEAVFTKDIPNADHPARVWLDPAGRIVFATEDNVLTVTFPAGVIPKEISRMMLDTN